MRLADAAGHEQRVVCGVPAEDPSPAVGGLPSDRIHPLVFEAGALDFPIPGMSDVMPYRSSVWSTLSEATIATYAEVFAAHISGVVRDVRPDVIHSHHVWIMSSLLKTIAPTVPVVTHCHATGLRQLRLAAQHAERVRAGVVRNDRFLVLHSGHEAQLVDELGVATDRVDVIGAGFRESIFHTDGRTAGSGDLVYAGKYSHAKGLPELLDALDPSVTLHVAGTGSGPEADALAARMAAMPNVVLHGMLDQTRLAALMRRCDVFVLPSYYEGLPLVLVEALACGCRLICTRLEGVEQQLAPALGEYLDLVDLPRLIGPDRPLPEDLPAYVDRLRTAIRGALARPALTTAPDAALEPFTWAAVFQRVEAIWRRVT